MPHHIKTLFFGACALFWSCTHGKATSSACDEELAHYAVHGFHSELFYARLTQQHHHELGDILRDLEAKEARSWLSQKEKNEVRGTWLSLAKQDGYDLSSRILYLGKALNRGWSSDAALLLADLCHRRAQEAQDPITQASIALRGLAVLNVNLQEPGYDLHKKLGAVSQLIALLEDLKDASKSITSDKGLPPHIYGDHFPEHCIPQAQACALLTVAYAGLILRRGVPKEPVRSMIYDNGVAAISLYQKGLEAQTTPAQRAFYHAQIVNLVQGLARTPDLFAQEREKYLQVQKRSALALARTYKDTMTDSENTYERAAYAYKTALSYMFAGKKDHALKYIALILKTPNDESENPAAMERLKVRAHHLMLQITDPTEVLAYECAHMAVFWGDGLG